MRREEIPAVRERAVVFPFTLPNTLLWVGLTALAYAGNAANLSLFFNVDFLFGTIPVLVILHFFGWAPATVSTLIAGAHTAVLWHHPYALIILTAEILLVGLLYRRRSDNLVLLDTLYWIVAGMPLVVLFYRGIMGVAPTNAFLIVFKQALNGIFNSLVASIVITVVEQIAPRLRHLPARKHLQFAQVIFLVMVAFVLIPAMTILVVTARQEMTRVEEDVQTRLTITAFSARQAVNAWVAENLQTLRSLSSNADLAEPAGQPQLRTEMRLLKTSDPDFAAILVTDPQGRVAAAEPEEAGRLLGTIQRDEWPFFASIIETMQGAASEVVFPRGDHGAPRVVLGVPIIAGDIVTGTVLGVVDAARLHDLLMRVTGNWAVDAVIVDANNRIVQSTSSDVPPHELFDRQFPGPYDPVDGELYIRVPEMVRNVSVMERWQFSEYSTRGRIGMSSSWTLSLHASIAPYQDALNQRYRSLMFVMILVVVFTILASAGVSRRMLASVAQLAAVAEDLPATVTRREEPDWPQSRIDEIHTLIQCLKITSEQLGESFTRIQDANAELTEAKHQAELANRTKSEFLANISHDLRTPLNGILGYAQILMRDTDINEETRNAVAIIEKSGNHLLNLINDILDVSRLEADKLQLRPSPFRLGNFLVDIADIVSLQARQKGLQLHVEIDDHLPSVVVGDEKRLRQVVLNLLNNAVKFTDAGHVWFRARHSQDTLFVEVQDTGIGIPADQHEAVFSPFKQLTKHIQSEEGTGLGLAIVKRLVEMMDGEVKVESVAGEGSTFLVNVRLPGTDQVPPDVRSPSTVIGYAGEARTILVVDDKEANRSVLRSLLVPLGFTVLEAADGEAGIRSMRERRPDLVLMDLVMPRMDGFAAIGRIRSDDDLRGCAVVAVSASVAHTVRDECVRLGFDDFLPKPFRDTDLLAVIRRLLKVTWTHRRAAGDAPAEAAEATETVPPIQHLTDLMEQVASGNIRGIVDAAERLESIDAEYRPFAERVRRLASDFQINRLSELVNGVRRNGGRGDE